MSAPKLKHYDEFKQILSSYHISEEGRKLLEKTELVLLVSPTSAGRNAIINELVRSGNYEYIVSDTTRPKRVNNGVEEQEGVEYYFRSEEDMLAELRAGKFLEAALIHEQQVSGISLRELQKAAEHDKIAIDEVEITGADNVIKVKPDAHCLFILPPSYETWMERLNKRGDMDQDEYINRLKSAEIELQTALERDYYRFVINDNLEQATKDVRRIVEEGQYTDAEHESAQDLAWKLVNKVKHILYS